MTQENFAACCAFVREQEGGNTDTPGDHGGRTGRGGITHVTYDAYRLRKGFTPRDVFKITDLEIDEIYASEYWALIYGDRLPAGQDLALFDYAINSGPAKANEARLLAGNADTPTLIHKICNGRLGFMHALGSWNRFGTGWTRRVAECEALALQMAGVLTPDIAHKAKRDHEAKRHRGPQAGTAGTGGAAAAHHFGMGFWVIAVIFAVMVIGVAISVFNSRRQGVRADVLADAVTQMQKAQAAAIAAQHAAFMQADAKAKAIAAEQAALDEAKAKIGSLGATMQTL